MRVEVAVFRRKLQKRSFHEIERGALGAMLFSARKRKRLTQAQLADQIDRALRTMQPTNQSDRQCDSVQPPFQPIPHRRLN